MSFAFGGAKLRDCRAGSHVAAISAAERSRAIKCPGGASCSPHCSSNAGFCRMTITSSAHSCGRASAAAATAAAASGARRPQHDLVAVVVRAVLERRVEEQRERHLDRRLDERTRPRQLERRRADRQLAADAVVDGVDDRVEAARLLRRHRHRPPRLLPVERFDAVGDAHHAVVAPAFVEAEELAQIREARAAHRRPRLLVAWSGIFALIPCSCEARLSCEGSP